MVPGPRSGEASAPGDDLVPGFRVYRVWGSGFGVQGLGFRVWGSGFRV